MGLHCTSISVCIHDLEDNILRYKTLDSLFDHILIYESCLTFFKLAVCGFLSVKYKIQFPLYDLNVGHFSILRVVILTTLATKKHVFCGG